MTGLLRLLFPKMDRRSPGRFRDARVNTAVQGSERKLKTSIALQRELKSIEIGLQKGAMRGRDTCR
jgi:hypothetical protein